MVKFLQKKFSWFNKITAVRCSYICSFVFAATAFGLLFAKLIGGNRDFEQGNAFVHAFGNGQNHVLLLIAVLLVMIVLAWSIYELVVTFVPKLSVMVFDNEDSSSQIAKSYNIVRLVIFSLLGLYCTFVFFFSRHIIVIPILGKVDNGILPVIPWLALFSFFAYFFCGLGDYFLNTNFDEEEFIEAQKEEVKEELKKEEPNKEEKKEEPNKEEVKEEKVAPKKANKKEEPEISEEDKQELASASTLKVSLKAATSVTKKDESVAKDSVSKHLKKLYGSKVEINNRPDYTDTGLPLADTYYVKKDKKKGCFVYVYETKGSSLFLVRLSRESYHKLKEEGITIARSKFPKAKPSEAWYSIVFDDKLSSERLYEILNDAYKHIEEKL